MMKNLLVALVLASASCAQTVQDDPSSAISLTGTWIGEVAGSLPEDEDKVTVKIVLKDEGGQLTGEMFAKDPIRDAFHRAGSVEGTRSDTEAQWRGFDQSVSGTFSGDSFSGQITIESDSGQPEQGTIQLRRQRE